MNEVYKELEKIRLKEGEKVALAAAQEMLKEHCKNNALMKARQVQDWQVRHERSGD